MSSPLADQANVARYLLEAAKTTPSTVRPSNSAPTTWTRLKVISKPGIYPRRKASSSAPLTALKPMTTWPSSQKHAHSSRLVRQSSTPPGGRSHGQSKRSRLSRGGFSFGNIGMSQRSPSFGHSYFLNRLLTHCLCQGAQITPDFGKHENIVHTPHGATMPLRHSDGTRAGPDMV